MAKITVTRIEAVTSEPGELETILRMVTHAQEDPPAAAAVQPRDVVALQPALPTPALEPVPAGHDEPIPGTLLDAGTNPVKSLALGERPAAESRRSRKLSNNSVRVNQAHKPLPAENPPPAVKTETDEGKAASLILKLVKEGPPRSVKELFQKMQELGWRGSETTIYAATLKMREQMLIIPIADLESGNVRKWHPAAAADGQRLTM